MKTFYLLAASLCISLSAQATEFFSLKGQMNFVICDQPSSDTRTCSSQFVNLDEINILLESNGSNSSAESSGSYDFAEKTIEGVKFGGQIYVNKFVNDDFYGTGYMLSISGWSERGDQFVHQLAGSVFTESPKTLNTIELSGRLVGWSPNKTIKQVFSIKAQ